jgi:hypothetical protein
MKVKELLEQLNALSEEDKELPITVASGVLIAADVKGIYKILSNGKMKSVPLKYIEIDHIGY